VEGGAAARLQALRKRHAKPSTKVVVQRTRKRMRDCTSWERSDLVKVRGRPGAPRGDARLSGLPGAAAGEPAGARRRAAAPRRRPERRLRPAARARQLGAALVNVLMDVAEVTPYRRDAAGRVLGGAPALPPVKAFWRRTAFRSDGRQHGILFCHDEVLRQISAAEQARPGAPAARSRAHGTEPVTTRRAGAGRARLRPAAAALRRRARAAQGLREAMVPQFMPMLVPARPWTHHDRGGHLLADQEVVRMHGNPAQRAELRDADAAPPAERRISQARPAPRSVTGAGCRRRARASRPALRTHAPAAARCRGAARACAPAGCEGACGAPRPRLYYPAATGVRRRAR